MTDVDDLEQHGVISFNGSAVAGNSTFFTNKGSICCGSATDQGGQVEFNGMSSAGHGTFVCTAAGPGGFLGGQTKFFNQSTAGEGLFIAEGGELNGGMTQFFDSSVWTTALSLPTEAESMAARLFSKVVRPLPTAFSP